MYFGLSGIAVALRAVAEQLDDAAADRAARRALDRVRTSFDGERWGPEFDLIGGNAGIALGAVLVADLTARATIDGAGTRWSNHEHRATPSTLEPRTGWAMGNAGIVRELLRFARIQTGGDPRYVVTWPDHPQVAS